MAGEDEILAGFGPIRINQPQTDNGQKIDTKGGKN